MPHAIFDADTGQMTMTTNHQLDSKLITLSQSKTKHVSLTPTEFNGDASPLYSGLRYNLADYFVRIRDLVCKGVPADVCPPSECTITLQMFPQFVNANTAWQEMKEDEPSACTAARNDKALPEWKKALEEMANHPKVAMVKVARNELDRQFSVFNRFSPPGTKFDCTFVRKPGEFLAATSAFFSNVTAPAKIVPKASTQAETIQIEDCWKDEAGAEKCLGDALALVGLTTEPMEGKGVALIATGKGISRFFGSDVSHEVTHPDADGNPIRPCQLTGTCPKSTEKDAPTGLGGVAPAKLTVPAPAAKPIAKPAAKKAPLALATAPEHKGMVSSMSQHMGKSMSYTGKGCRADPNGVFVIQANGETQFIRANEQAMHGPNKPNTAKKVLDLEEIDLKLHNCADCEKKGKMELRNTESAAARDRRWNQFLGENNDDKPISLSAVVDPPVVVASSVGEPVVLAPSVVPSAIKKVRTEEEYIAASSNAEATRRAFAEHAEALRQAGVINRMLS